MQKKDRGSKTQLTQAQLALINIVSNLPGHVYWKDKNGVYLGCNDRQAKSLGFSQSSMVVGKTDFELPWAKGVAEKFRKNDLMIMETGDSQTIEEPSQMEGNPVIVLSQKTPLKDIDGKIVGVLGISFDITDRKKMELDLQQAKEKAEVANKAKSEFLRNMEHQIRTPFSGLYSMVQLLAGSETNPEKKEMMEMTYQAAKELLEFLNTIIELSRDEIDTTPILAKKFDLKELLNKSVIMEKPQAVYKHLELTYHYPEIPTVFISDPIRIRRIFLNLLGNAIKFTAKGHVAVEVKLAKEKDEKHCIIQIIVSDTGIGIAEDKHHLIYEQFYRVYPANQNKYVGAGLGLYIVKQLMADLGGEMEVVSAPNQGSTFICTLPLERPLVDEVLDDVEDEQDGLG